jgi:hypothetical protein
MYDGSVEDVPAYFAARDQPLPPKYNPADWIMIVAQSVPVQELEQLGFFEPEPEPVEPYHRESVRRSIKKMRVRRKAIKEMHLQHVGFCTQLWMQVKRDMISLRRDKQLLGVRIVLTSFISILSGIIFWQVADTPLDDPSVRCV